MFHCFLLTGSWECSIVFSSQTECSILLSSQAADNIPLFYPHRQNVPLFSPHRQLRIFHCFILTDRIFHCFLLTDSWECSIVFSSQAAQHAQRDSQELFQSRFFQEHEDDDDVCTADAIIYQLRANGVMVYVPRSDLKNTTLLWIRSICIVHNYAKHKDQKRSFFFSPCACWSCWTLDAISSWCNSVQFHAWHHFTLYCHLTQFNTCCRKLLNELWHVSSGLPVLFEELDSRLLVSVLRWVQIPDLLFIHFVSSEHFATGQDMQHVIISYYGTSWDLFLFLLYIYFILFANKGLNCCVMFVSLLSYELLNLFWVVLCTEVYLFTRPCQESWCGLTV